MIDAPGLYLQYWQYHDFSLCAFRTLELQIHPTTMLPDMEFVTYLSSTNIAKSGIWWFTRSVIVAIRGMLIAYYAIKLL